MKPRDLETKLTPEKCRERFREHIEAFKKQFETSTTVSGDCSAQQEDMMQLIAMTETRIQYWESRRNLFFTLALGLLAASLAAIGVVMENLAFSIKIISALPQAYYSTLAGFSICVFVGSIRLLFVWNRQNSPFYPFTRVAEAWRFQYRYAEECSRPGGEVASLSTDGGDELDALKDMENYLKSLNSYAKKTLNLSRSETLEQSIAQLFLLIHNEKYKIEFLNQLRDCFRRILAWATTTGCIVLVLHLLVYFLNSSWLHFYVAK